MKLFRLLILVQGSYTLLTGIWPLIHLESFLAVTGYKTDQWLVKTVGALLIPIAVTLLSYLFVKTDFLPALILGSLTSCVFIIIDFYYSAERDAIRDIYQLDGFVEVIFLAGWIFLFVFRKKELSVRP